MPCLRSRKLPTVHELIRTSSKNPPRTCELPFSLQPLTIMDRGTTLGNTRAIEARILAALAMPPIGEYMTIKSRRFRFAACACAMLSAAGPLSAQEWLRVTSPDGRNVVSVGLHEGRLHYAVERRGRSIVMPSVLGFEFRGAPRLRDSLRITGNARNAVNQTWTQPWGEVARVRDHHNELRVSVVETAPPVRRFDVVFRVFNDGVGFRYEVPAQPALGEFEISDELTQFALADDSRAWWIPANRPRLDRSEMLYASSPVSVVDTVQTPLTMEMREGSGFVVIHEANLVDYARMNLAGSRMENRTLRSALAPLAGGAKVKGRTPFVTPWRTIQVADRA